MISPSRHRLAEFELLVMLAIVRRRDDAYGAAIRREIEQRTGRPAAIGAVYATLGRLRDKGFVDFSVSAPLPQKGGRSRKMYRLTPSGTLALNQSAVGLTNMLDGLGITSDPRGPVQ